MSNDKTEITFLKRLFELFVCVFYTWYFLPVCNALLPNDRFKLLFFGFFAVGCVGLFLIGGIRINTVMVAVLSYIVVFTLLFVRGFGDISSHIRVSFTFWGTAILYFGILKEDSRRRIGKYLIFLFLITVVTSSIGVFIDNSAARTIAHAGADDALQASYKMKNIGSIYLFQGLVFSVPMLICMPKNKLQRVISIFLLVAVLAVLLNASFTISLLLFFVAVFLSVTQSKNSINRIILTGVFGVLAVALLYNMSDILLFLSSVIDNYKITDKLYEASKIFSGDVLTGDVAERLELYKVSLNTFSQNLLGTGAHYSYIKFEDNIGYHSQLFDDLARYGLFALAYYITFLTGYFIHMKEQWKKVDCARIAGIITVIYAMFLTLNLGFRSSEESVLMLFILPVLPDILVKWKEKKAQKKEEGIAVNENTVYNPKADVFRRTENDGVDCKSNGKKR